MIRNFVFLIIVQGYLTRWLVTTVPFWEIYMHSKLHEFCVHAQINAWLHHFGWRILLSTAQSISTISSWSFQLQSQRKKSKLKTRLYNSGCSTILVFWLTYDQTKFLRHTRFLRLHFNPTIKVKLLESSFHWYLILWYENLWQVVEVCHISTTS